MHSITHRVEPWIITRPHVPAGPARRFVQRLALRALLLGLALGVAVGSARAETVNCTPITSLPAVITVQGVYCLVFNLGTNMTSGNAITIQTNNVVLDLNGFKLGGLAAGPGTTAIGIRATTRQNITIKNGTIRGFHLGVLLDGSASQGHVVEDIRADQNTLIGIEVAGSGHIVRNNQVVTTGGTTVGSNANAFGIVAVSADGPRVLNNDVINTFGQGSGTGRGIFLQNVSSGLVVNNRITTADVGINYFGSDGKYRDNLTFDVTTPFVGGGTNAGNNN